MKSTKLLSSIAALLALVLLAAACGGGSDEELSGNDQALVDAVAAAMVADGDVPPGVDVNCMATAMVNGLGGAEGMAELGFTVDTISADNDISDIDLPQDQAVALTERLWACDLADVMVQGMTGGGLAADDARCLIEKIDQDALQDMFAADFMSEAEGAAFGEEAQGRMFSSLIGAMADCDLDPSSLGL